VHSFGAFISVYNRLPSSWDGRTDGRTDGGGPRFRRDGHGTDCFIFPANAVGNETRAVHHAAAAASLAIHDERETGRDERAATDYL